MGDSIKQAVTWAKNQLGVTIGISTVAGWPEYNEARKAKNALRNQAAREAGESTLCANINNLNKNLEQLQAERESLVPQLGTFKAESGEYYRIRQSLKGIDSSITDYFEKYIKVLATVRGTNIELNESQQSAAIEDVFAELDSMISEADQPIEDPSEESN